MKKILMIALAMLLGASSSLAGALPMQVFAVDNSNGKITAKSVEEAFNASDLKVDVNNNMNSIFEKRYGNVHHKSYNLAIFTNHDLVMKLMKKHPSIGLITPLSMSIYSDDAKKTINISTLSLHGMSRITKIPETNEDLIKYAKLLDAAMHKALPNGKYVELKNNSKNEASVTAVQKEFSLETIVKDVIEKLKVFENKYNKKIPVIAAGGIYDSYVEAKEDFESEFESELGPVGFLVPKSYKYDVAEYDFFDTYSIIRFNVIFPVSKDHPEAGAFAPFSLSIYKKKNEETVHVAYPSIDNWINDLGIKDEKTVSEVRKTHSMVKGILEELTE